MIMQMINLKEIFTKCHTEKNYRFRCSSRLTFVVKLRYEDMPSTIY